MSIVSFYIYNEDMDKINTLGPICKFLTRDYWADKVMCQGASGNCTSYDPC